jgi:hypothetical protein
VSLLDMLEFAARPYLEITHRFGLLLAIGKPPDPDVVRDLWSDLLKETARLDLPVTKELIVCLFENIAKENPTKVTCSSDGFEFKGAHLPLDRMKHHVESIYKTLTAELGSVLLRVIPREKAKYAGSGWLSGSDIRSKFPTSITELERGARCYAFGEPTACVFHSMRALEPGLAALAKPFNVSASHDNWQNIINEVEAAIRGLGALPKSQQKIEDEKFFGGAVAHLYFIKNAWRNHVAHTRDSYSDDEARKVLDRSKDFVESLCPRLRETEGI